MPDSPPLTPAPARVFPTRLSYALLFLLAGAAVFYASLVPVAYDAKRTWESGLEHWRHLPTYDIGVYRRADLLANAVLFAPLGFLLAGAVACDRGSLRLWRDGGPSFAGLIGAVIVGAAMTWALRWLASSIELAQFWFPPRTMSTNDIDAETVGSVAGIAAWFTLGPWLTGIVRDALGGTDPVRARRGVLIAYMAALFLYSLLPLDITIKPSELARKWHEGRITLVPFMGPDGVRWSLVKAARDVLLFAPVGVLLRQRWLTGRDRWPRGVAAVAGLTLALAGALEFARIFVFICNVDVTAVLARAAGGALGARLFGGWLDEDAGVTLGAAWDARRRARVARRLGLAVLAVVIVLLAKAARVDKPPAGLSDRLHAAVEWPFKRYYYAGEWTALSIVVHHMALFAPLGALRRWKQGPTARPGRAWIGIAMRIGALSAAIFLIQAALGRQPDTSDLFIHPLGAIAGWIAADLFLARPRSTMSPGEKASTTPASRPRGTA